MSLRSTPPAGRRMTPPKPRPATRTELTWYSLIEIWNGLNSSAPRNCLEATNRRASGSVAAMIQRFAHVCFRKLGSISIDGGVALLMNTGRSVCDLNRHTLSLFNTHSLVKSATIIGGFD
jgi:hypothetical protein